MLKPLHMQDVEVALQSMIQSLQEEFGEDLRAVAVFGSQARGTATPGSDIDLLVVIQGLVRDWQSIHRLEDAWSRRGRRWGKRFQIVLASPEDVEDSVEGAAPLMLEIYNAHQVVFDQNGFLRDGMIRMARLMRERGIRLRKSGVWEVPEHAVPS